jgi:D-glucosaminate-6-phosphate ammonia-lyase
MKMGIYDRLGVRPVINCATSYTRLGGSVMAPQVAQAMADAAGCFVRLDELQEAVGSRIASLTGNDAAYVTNGAAAGLALATAACMTGDDLAAMARLPHDVAGLRHEIIVHRTQRNFYDFAIRQVGGRLVEIGHAMETASWELDAAFNERTAAVFYFAGTHLNRQTLPLPLVIERAHAFGVPVIVDAAAQIPPVTGLWHYTVDLGADLAIFSGGKGLAGPQNSGLVVGRADLIRAISLNGPPNQRIGRPMKVGKEAMIGLLTAIERYLDPDLAAGRAMQEADWSAGIHQWTEVWSRYAPDGVSLVRHETNEAGEPIPRLVIRFADGAPLGRDEFVHALHATEPRIEVVIPDETSVALSFHLLLDGQAEIVEDRVRTLLQQFPPATLRPEPMPVTSNGRGERDRLR